MSQVVIAGDTSGTITLQAPAVSGSNTLNLPAATGTVMVSGNMPAFSAYQNSGTTLGTLTYTKIAFQAKEFDTANAFDNTTNYRFQPLVAGYYQVNAGAQISSGTAYEALLAIYKNGTNYKYGTDIISSTVYGITISGLVYLNGSTDYIEIYAYNGPISRSTSPSSVGTYFQAAMIRSS